MNIGRRLKIEVTTVEGKIKVEVEIITKWVMKIRIKEVLLK